MINIYSTLTHLLSFAFFLIPSQCGDFQAAVLTERSNMEETCHSSAEESFSPLRFSLPGELPAQKLLLLLSPKVVQTSKDDLSPTAVKV